MVIARLKKEKELKDSDLVTVVSNKQVVKSGLVKKFISIGGYMMSMEIAIYNLLEDFREVKQSVLDLACDFRSKAIYVSDTNMLLETSEIDDPLAPFEERKARRFRSENI